MVELQQVEGGGSDETTTPPGLNRGWLGTRRDEWNPPQNSRYYHAKARVRPDKDGVRDKLSPKTRAMMIDNARTVGELRTRFPVFTRDDARRVRTPTLLISGETSALVLRRIADILADSIPNAERARILGAGHFPHLDRGEEFNARVVGFLQRDS